MQALKANIYVNSPGGRLLHQSEVFTGAGLELKFLIPYAGESESILTALVSAPAELMRDQLRRQTQVVDN